MALGPPGHGTCGNCGTSSTNTRWTALRLPIDGGAALAVANEHQPRHRIHARHDTDVELTESVRHCGGGATAPSNRPRVIGDEPFDPASLSGCLDGFGTVMGASPADGVVGGMSREDGHAGDDGAGSAGTADAGDLTRCPRSGAQVGVDNGGGDADLSMHNDDLHTQIVVFILKGFAGALLPAAMESNAVVLITESLDRDGFELLEGWAP